MTYPGADPLIPRMTKSQKPPHRQAVAPARGSAPTRVHDAPSGRVQFDDRGNAVWEWAVSTGAFGRDV